MKLLVLLLLAAPIPMMAQVGGGPLNSGGGTGGGSGSSGVSSYNNRTGTVTPQSGDYTAQQVGAAPAANPAGGAGNYAPIASPAFTGTVTASALVGSSGTPSSLASFTNLNPNGLANASGFNAGLNVYAGNGYYYGMQMGAVAGLFSTSLYAPTGAAVTACFYTAGTTPATQADFTCPWILSSTKAVLAVPLQVSALQSGSSGNTDLNGTLTLTGGQATYTFTGTYATRLKCTANDITNTAAVRPASTTTSVTFYGTVGDSVDYNCSGGN